jgi:hypothetical protein
VAGFPSWEAAIRATADLDADRAAERLGVSARGIRDWRRRLAIVAIVPGKSPRPRARLVAAAAAAGHPSWAEAVRRTAGMPAETAARSLGVTGAMLCEARRKVVGAAAGTRAERRRTAAAAAGHSSWEEAIRATRAMPVRTAAEALGVTHATITRARTASGVAAVTPQDRRQDRAVAAGYPPHERLRSRRSWR